MKAWVDTVETKLAGLGESLTGVKEMRLQLFDLEQKMARTPGPGGGDYGMTWGNEFVAAKGDDLRGIGPSGGRGRIAMQLKTTITSGTGSGGDLIVPTRDMSVGLPQRRMTIRSLLTAIKVESGSVEFARQTARPSAAAMVAEGATKPESAMTCDLATANMRTIAHWIPASRQVLDDAPQLAGLIDTELRYGLALKEESQLLYGDGTGQNLTGMVPAATPFAAPFAVAGATMIDNIGLAILQTSLTDYLPDGIVVHPSDWWRMRLLKDTQGKYLLGDPGVAAAPSLFGLPVIPTQALSIDKFLVGGFAGQTLYDRWEARVEVSTEHSDFFTRNLVAILAEERIGLAVKTPLALTYGDFGNVV